jgi:hypothetical protein
VATVITSSTDLLVRVTVINYRDASLNACAVDLLCSGQHISLWKG